MFKYIIKLFKKNKQIIYCIFLDYEAILNNELKSFVMQNIKDDLKIHKKKVIDVDFYIDSASGKNIIIIGTDKIENIYFRPLVYQLYAFLKKEDLEVFSYKYEVMDRVKKLIENKFKEKGIEILKFTINA